MAFILSDSPLITLTTTGSLFSGGVSIILISLMPDNESCSVLGIGVALNVNVSTFLLIDAIFSLWLTPNRCSSSIIKSPKSLNDKSFDKIL